MFCSGVATTSLENVYFFEYEEEPNDERAVNSYLDAKIVRYREQDVKAKRAINDKNYITRELLKGYFGQMCTHCGFCLGFEIVNGQVLSEMTAQRLNNSIAHELDNVEPMCITCNCALSNRC